MVYPRTFATARGPVYLVEPAPGTLKGLVGDLLAEVNGRARTRRLERADLMPVLGTGCGVMTLTGCGDAHQSTYACTELNVAWCMEAGRKVVRITGTRAGLHHNRSDFVECSTDPAAWETEVALSYVLSAGSPRLQDIRTELRGAFVEHCLRPFGEQGEDDRLSIWNPFLIASAPPAGAIIADNPNHPQVVQVVVRDPATGLRHHLTVPPRFADPKSKTFRKLRTDAARVRAAVAWTFGLSPEEYAPQIEA